VYTNSPGGSDYTLAQTQLDQARANLDTARARLGYTVVVAPLAGTLISRNVEVGYVVQPSMVLMRLSPAGRTQLVIDVDEKNIGKLRIGQRALASADAYPNQRFAAEVAYINPGVDIDRATIEVKLDVPEPPASLLQDMTVSVDIETARHQNALLLPAADVRDGKGNSPWVLVIEEGRAVRRAVTLGLADIDHVEILSGLREGDLVISPLAQVAAGGRVRARAAE
jgi:HlyD family secretion protein